jgi:hypothetical protein
VKAPAGSLERAWLLHDIGRCHLELGHDSKAAEFVDSCIGVVDALRDRRWGINAYVLLAQIEGEFSSHEKASSY